ncbi:MAG TPA: SIR2 family protein [Blastocatellia bacterium]|jgi:hypothetical protein|nr:SIR2 family protein [Blastocatellia bacterium]
MSASSRTVNRPKLPEVDWDLLVSRIRQGKCTPFLGAGACAGVLPLGKDIAQAWARRYEYPLRDSTDLVRVAQFLAVQARDSLFPKEKIKAQFENIAPPDFNQPCEIHGILADLPLPMYITTNYDDFMVKALSSRGKEPLTELCRWNDALKESPSIFDQEPKVTLTPQRPVVFHMHGHISEPESIVLTEDDYLDFLINMSEDPQLLPPPIREALTKTSLLFLGYRLADWNFRVVFRSLVSYLKRGFARAHVSVQVAPGRLSPNQLGRAIEYLDNYFKELKVSVYWGTCQEFARDLSEKMRK